MIFLDHIAKWFFSALTALVLTLFCGTILVTISAEFVAPPRIQTAARSIASGNLRQIAQASLIYAVDHEGRLPDATDLPDYARQLALHGGLNDPSCWVASGRQTAIPSDLKTVLVFTPDGSRTLDPRFAQLPHLFAVVLGGLTNQHPGTTPIAWTRGLDLETGEWRKDSPYGGEGGHIVFLGGDCRFFRKLTNSSGGELTGRDGRPTHRILDALPANARVSDDATLPVREPTWTDRVGRLGHRLAEGARMAILLAWPLWMLVLFLKLTLGFARTWGVPLHELKIEPQARWLLISPAVLLALSVVFRA